MQLNWSQINYAPKPKLHDMLDKYSQVFSDELGTMVGQKATIDMARPRFHKAHTVPYADKE